ncbi:MAG: hypothetical protein WBA76_20955 [Phormidesmis sp.]
MEFAFVLLAKLIVWIRPALPIICAALAWTITAMLILNVVAMVRQGLANVQKMHRIPCANCLYATDSYRLKCSVRPVEAFSEQAISCQDFAAKGLTTEDLAAR